MSVGWNPWHGCRKISEGCRHCYVYRQDERHDKDSSEVRKTSAFNLPVRRSRDGRFKVPAGEMVYTCFTSDFLVEEADTWRAEAWEMIRTRSDLRFFFITKRIDRLMQVLPPDIEEVSAGGESGSDARPCDFDWVLSIRRQCLDADIPFCYHQTGARLVKDGRLYRIRRRFQHAQARKAGIDYKVKR